MYEVQESGGCVWYDSVGVRRSWSADMEQTFGSAERVTEEQGWLLGRARDAD